MSNWWPIIGELIGGSVTLLAAIAVTLWRRRKF